MARLWSSGGELNSTTANVEWTAVTNATLDATTVRSGTYSPRVNRTTSSGFLRYQYKSAAFSGAIYFRSYVRFATFPSVTVDFMSTNNGGGGAQVAIKCTNGGVLQLFNSEDNSQIGSDSSAISLNTWYRIELLLDTTTLASSTVTALIDGTQFATGTANLAQGQLSFLIGNTLANATLDVYFDDIAINDSSGSFQNSWPGEGEIIHLRPNADGGLDEWHATTTYENIDEVTPDDVTTLITTGSDDQTHDVEVDATPAALASDDTINVVQVGVRFNTTSTAGTNPTFVLRIAADIGSTVEESANITASTTTWNTNAVAAPRNYVLTIYDLPGASTTAWTKTDLDEAVIGVRSTNNGTGAPQVSTLWLLVDHKPAAAPAGGGSDPVPVMSNGLFWNSVDR